MFVNADTVRTHFLVYAYFDALVKWTGQEQVTRGHRSFDKESQTFCSLGNNIVYIFPQLETLKKLSIGEDSVKWFVEEMMQFEKAALAFYYEENWLQF